MPKTVFAETDGDQGLVDFGEADDLHLHHQQGFVAGVDVKALSR